MIEPSLASYKISTPYAVSSASVFLFFNYLGKMCFVCLFLSVIACSGLQFEMYTLVMDSWSAPHFNA